MRASTAVGKGESVSIVVFSVEQGTYVLIDTFCPSILVLYITIYDAIIQLMTFGIIH